MRSLFTVVATVTILSLSAFAQPTHDYIRWQNKTRKFIKFIPPDIQPGESLPLVINMHPFLTDGSFQMNYTRFNFVADTARVIVVYPYGIQGRWNSGAFAGIESPIDDLGFLNLLIDYMAILHNIDTRRVYATGYSAGGFMSHKLACDLTNRIAAIAPVSASMNPELLDMCVPDRPMPVQIFNGTADAIVAYDGFELTGTAAVEDVVNFWRSANNTFIPVQEELLPDLDPADNTLTTRFTWTGPEAGSEVIFYKSEGGGHTWPGRNFPLLGNTAMDFKANNEIWNFFKRYAIPEELSCERPSNTSVTWGDGTATLSWDPVPGVESYNLLYFLTDGDLQYLEGIADNALQIEAAAGQEIIWLVRAQCTSGHVSWSTIQRDNLSGRTESGRLAVRAWPNPVMDRLQVALTEIDVPMEYAVVDAVGQEVLRGMLDPHEAALDVSSLTPGIYHLVLQGTARAGTTFRKW